MKVLVTDGGRGQAHGAVSAVRALARAGHEVHVTVSGPLSTAGWSRHCSRRVWVPPAEAPDYADVVRRLKATEPYDVVFPTSDAALLRLGWPGAELVDKEHLRARAEAAGLATPKQWSFADADEALDSAGDLPWPVAVKPTARGSHTAMRAFRADDPSDLEVLRGSPDPVVVQEWLSGEQRCIAGVVWQGRLRAVVHQRYLRTWPLDCGDACFAVTTGPDEELEAGVTALLEGYDGMFQCELLDGRVHDLNPRVFGSLDLAVRAGVNLPDLVCRLSAGEAVPAETVRARPGVHYRWVEGELRHLLRARKAEQMPAGAALEALRPRRGTAHADVSPSDPVPSLMRVTYAARSRSRADGATSSTAGRQGGGGMKVLVTDGGRGQAHGALSAVRALARAGHEVHVTVSEPFSTAGWSRHCRRRIEVPPAEQPEYLDAVRELCDSEVYDVVFPASDAALLTLGWPGSELVDKLHLHRTATAAGLPTPSQWSFDHGDDVIRSARELRWPVAVKPAAKSSHTAPPVFRADSADDLQVLADFPDPVVVEEWLGGEQRAVGGVMWKGRLRAVVHQRYVRTWPRDCGIAAYAVTTGPDEALEAGLTELLQGYDGLFQCQLLDGRLHDLNPRVYGSLLLGARAGVNLPDLVCRLTAGEDVGADELLRAPAGVAYRWVEGELRHLAQAWHEDDITAVSALRALRPQRGTAHPDVWPSDPGPSLARLSYAVRSRRWGR